MNLKRKVPFVLSYLVLAMGLTGCLDLDESVEVKDTQLPTAVAIQAGNTDRAASVWLNFNDDKVGDTIMQDVYVPKKGLTPYTYYSVLNWNA